MSRNFNLTVSIDYILSVIRRYFYFTSKCRNNPKNYKLSSFKFIYRVGSHLVAPNGPAIKGVCVAERTEAVG